MPAAAPSNIALYSDFAGSAGAPYPPGWQIMYTGESGYQLNGSGLFVPSGTGWKGGVTTAGFTRGATPGGVMVDYAALPINSGNPCFLSLSDNVLDQGFGYYIRWAIGTDFQLARYGGSSTFLDGIDEIDLVGGTPAAGNVILALMADAAAVTAYISQTGGASWQQIGTANDTTYGGVMYGAIESNSSATTPTHDNFWLGLNGSASPEVGRFPNPDFPLSRGR